MNKRILTKSSSPSIEDQERKPAENLTNLKLMRTHNEYINSPVEDLERKAAGDPISLTHTACIYTQQHHVTFVNQRWWSNNGTCEGLIWHKFDLGSRQERLDKTEGKNFSPLMQP
jgi:hypothetical protein